MSTKMRLRNYKPNGNKSCIDRIRTVHITAKNFHMPRRPVKNWGSLMLARNIVLIEGNASSGKENYCMLHKCNKKLFERHTVVYYG